jgi:hypothetical protein
MTTTLTQALITRSSTLVRGGGGSRVSSYRILFCVVMLRQPLAGSSRIRCRQSRCGA